MTNLLSTSVKTALDSNILFADALVFCPMVGIMKICGTVLNKVAFNNH